VRTEWSLELYRGYVRENSDDTAERCQIGERLIGRAGTGISWQRKDASRHSPSQHRRVGATSWLVTVARVYVLEAQTKEASR
jgi:hypothetical protein